MFVFDGHADTPSLMVDQGYDIGVRNARGHLDLPRMLEAGWRAQFLSLFVEPKYIEKGECVRRVLEMADACRRAAEAYPDRFALARTAGEVERILDAGRVAGVLAIEGGHAIDDSLAVLREFFALGVRYMTLTWNNTNHWADACLEPGVHHGLTDFGVAVVLEMQRLGMLVDVSHVSEETFWAVMKVATRPVIASHSSCRALCDWPRNLRDEQWKALAANGGVAGINFYSGFVEPGWLTPGPRDLKDFRMDDPEEAKRPRPAFDRVIEHILHAVKVAGVDHVGLGADFDGVPNLPQGIDDCTAWPRIAAALKARGLSDRDIAKIAGENMLRVFREAGPC